jgi:hypothetical protein
VPWRALTELSAILAELYALIDFVLRRTRIGPICAADLSPEFSVNHSCGHVSIVISIKIEAFPQRLWRIEPRKLKEEEGR